MKYLSGLPFFEMQFTKAGVISDNTELDVLLEGIQSEKLTDLIIISHGWNNDMDEAKDLYERIFQFVAEEIKKAELNGRELGVLGVYWPSKKLAEKDLIPGGAAAASETDTINIEKQINELQGFFDYADADRHLEKIRASLQPTGSADPEKAVYDGFVGLFGPLVQYQIKLPDEDAARYFDLANIKEILIATQVDIESSIIPVAVGGTAQIGSLRPVNSGAQGAAGISSFISGLKKGIFNLLNLATYYQMKERAGRVGSIGLNDVIRRIRAVAPSIGIHLIGHSFGARLVSASVVGTDNQNAVKVQSLILLQAAFSHYGFAQNYGEEGENGVFRGIIDNKSISGAIIISHSKHDKAVGIAYPIASHIAKQAGSALGDKDDFYGGLGSNGAQKTPGTINDLVKEVGKTYLFEDGKIYNINADEFIAGHSEIANKVVAELIVSAIGWSTKNKTS